MIHVRNLYTLHELDGLMRVQTGQAHITFFEFVTQEYLFHALLARRVEPQMKRGKRAA